MLGNGNLIKKKKKELLSENILGLWDNSLKISALKFIYVPVINHKQDWKHLKKFILWNYIFRKAPNYL